MADAPQLSPERFENLVRRAVEWKRIEIVCRPLRLFTHRRALALRRFRYHVNKTACELAEGDEGKAALYSLQIHVAASEAADMALRVTT